MKSVKPIQAINPVFALIVLVVVGLSTVFLATPYYPLAVLPAFAVIFVLLIGRFPEFGYYLIIFLIPFGAYRGLAGQFSFIRLPWIIAICLVLLIFLRQLFKKSVPGDMRSNFWPLLFVFFAVNLISALFSSYKVTAFLNIAFLGVAFCFIALNLTFISQNGFRKTLPLVLIWSITLGSFLAIIGYIFELPFLTNSSRGTGATMDPNNMSLMIIFVLPLLVYRFLYERQVWSRFLMLIFILVNLFALVTTFSRGGALVFVPTIFLIFIEYAPRIRSKYLGLIIAVLSFSLVVGLIAVPSTYWQRQKSITDWNDSALKRRTTYLYVAFEIFKRDPLLGAGPGVFRDIYVESAYAKKIAREGKMSRRFAHNTYLEILTGTGISGLILFLAVLSVAFWNFTRAKKNYFYRNDLKMTALVGAYRISYLSLLLYLFIFSDIYHKYLLLSLPLSQVALRLSSQEQK